MTRREAFVAFAMELLQDAQRALRIWHARQWWGVEIDGTLQSFTKVRLQHEHMAGPKGRLP